MDFIAKFLHASRHVESPERFLIWGALSAISATLRHNVWISHPERGPNARIYPNTYILLLASSAECRKSAPLNIVSSLLSKVGNTKIIRGVSSLEGILRTLSEVSVRNNKQVTGGSGILIAEELRASISRYSKTAIETLTDMYDPRVGDTFEKILSHSENSFRVKDLCFSILGASNEELLASMFNSEAIYGGLVSRFMIVYEVERRKKVSGMLIRPEDYPDWSECEEHLSRISKIEGEVFLSEEVREFYDDWYLKFKIPKEYQTQTGFEGRFHTHVEKVAILLAAAEYTEGMLRITVDMMKKAISLVANLTPAYKRLETAVGLSTPASTLDLRKKLQVEVILTIMREEKYTIDSRVLKRKIFAKGLDISLVDSILNDFENMGYLAVEYAGDMRKIIATQQLIDFYQTLQVKGLPRA